MRCYLFNIVLGINIPNSSDIMLWASRARSMHFCHIAASCLLTYISIAFCTLHYGSIRCLVPSSNLSTHLYVANLRSVPSPPGEGALVGLAPPKQSSKPPNWNMKHYKSEEFLSNFNIMPPLHERKAPPRKRNPPYWRFSCDGSAFDADILRTHELHWQRLWNWFFVFIIETCIILSQL